jgi:hypothetical protein
LRHDLAQLGIDARRILPHPFVNRTINKGAEMDFSVTSEQVAWRDGWIEANEAIGILLVNIASALLGRRFDQRR